MVSNLDGIQALRHSYSDAKGAFQVGSNSTSLSATPTISTSAYTADDQLGDIKTLTAAVLTEGGTGVIQSVAITDASKQEVALNILVFSSSPTVTSSDNGTLAISAAELASKFLGHIAVAAADYTTLNAASVATVKGVSLPVKSTTGSKDLYFICQAVGTPTYTTTTALTLTFGILQD